VEESGLFFFYRDICAALNNEALVSLWLKIVFSLESSFHAALCHCVLVRGVGEMPPCGNDFSATEEGFTGSSIR